MVSSSREQAAEKSLNNLDDSMVVPFSVLGLSLLGRILGKDAAAAAVDEEGCCSFFLVRFLNLIELGCSTLCIFVSLQVFRHKLSAEDDDRVLTDIF